MIFIAVCERGRRAFAERDRSQWPFADTAEWHVVPREFGVMLTENDAISFVATRDATASRAFYESTLGLTLVSDEPFALVFDLNGHMLRIAKTNELTPAKHTVLGWHVEDVASKVTTLVGRGVVFERFEGLPQDALGIWTSPSGARVAWFKDPDGNHLSLTQF